MAPIRSTAGPAVRRAFSERRNAVVPPEALAELGGLLAERLCDGDHRGAKGVVNDALSRGVPPVDVSSHVIAPAMRRVGDLWESGLVTVAGEHLATSITERLLVHVYERLIDNPAASRPRVVLTAGGREEHALGLRMCADVLEGAGYDVRYLGGRVSVDALLAAASRYRPSLLGITMTIPDPKWLRDVLARLAALDPNLAVMLGGAATAHLTSRDPLVRVVGDVSELRLIADALLAERRVGERGRGGWPVTWLNGAESAEPPPSTRVPSIHGRLADNAAEMADLVRRHARVAHDQRRASFEDPLTGLWNRRAFEDRLAEAAPRQTAPMTLVSVDVDNLREVNEVLGHHVGDDVLRAVARALKAQLREYDFVARMGGDEFACILLRATGEEALATAERLRAAVGASTSPTVTVSIGVAPIDGDARAVLMRADEALYRAKRDGRDAVRLAEAYE